MHTRKYKNSREMADDLTICKATKKPVEIEFVRLTMGNVRHVEAWIRLSPRGWAEKGLDYLEIQTLEGTMRANLGDVIIKGVHGEFYPCDPDIFIKTYNFSQ